MSMSTTPRRQQRHPFFWPDRLTRADMLRMLPVALGREVTLDAPFPCVLPGHDDHDAVVHGDTFGYECLGACAIYARRT